MMDNITEILLEAERLNDHKKYFSDEEKIKEYENFIKNIVFSKEIKIMFYNKSRYPQNLYNEKFKESMIEKISRIQDQAASAKDSIDSLDCLMDDLISFF